VRRENGRSFWLASLLLSEVFPLNRWVLSFKK
jgi:hypothetical protein